MQKTDYKEKGQYFTPKPIVHALITRLIKYFPENYSDKTLKVLDPALGKGIFLKTLIPLIYPQFSAKLWGIDIDSSVLDIAKEELDPLLTRFPFDILLKSGNFFLYALSEMQIKEFDVIIGNPPYNARYSRSEWENIRKDCKSCHTNRIRSESSVFFTLKSLDLLKTGGLLCFLLPKPIIYSKRWTEFRRILLTKYWLVEVLDLGNQFTGQLQEQCAVIIRKIQPEEKQVEYLTGVWNSFNERFEQFCMTPTSMAILVDNLLVGVNTSELKIIQRLYTEEFEFLDVKAFRGISSQYRSRQGMIPLIEKANFVNGFLLPARSYLKTRTPQKKFKRQQTPKIIAQRIISYRTKPTYSINVKTWVDKKGRIVTHETVINIIPNYSQESHSLMAIAGILESSFVEWWLRHVVYTKKFVTSKDFDRAYLRMIRIPRISGIKSQDYRKRLSELLKLKQYEKIMDDVILQSDIDKLFTLGEIYSIYQKTGEEIKNKIHQVMQEKKIQDLNQKKEDFQNFRWFYRQLNNRKNIEKIMHSVANSKSGVQHLEVIIKKYEELNTLKIYINDIVFSLYKITPEELRIVKKKKQNKKLLSHVDNLIVSVFWRLQQFYKKKRV
ncbi:MAG: N-6 DNA methylase [Candidatus Heimdallarchaeota archaeon]|nr:MAG: N-6 DNA methylase [Candidatus Heimdallarchaeota archaeon]